MDNSKLVAPKDLSIFWPGPITKDAQVSPMNDERKSCICEASYYRNCVMLRLLVYNISDKCTSVIRVKNYDYVLISMTSRRRVRWSGRRGLCCNLVSDSSHSSSQLQKTPSSFVCTERDVLPFDDHIRTCFTYALWRCQRTHHESSNKSTYLLFRLLGYKHMILPRSLLA